MRVKIYRRRSRRTRRRFFHRVAVDTPPAYQNVLGLRKLYRFGDLYFFDCAGVRLLLDKVTDGMAITPSGCIYLRCADIALTCAELERRGVSVTSPLT
jgi:hypothetical protein